MSNRRGTSILEYVVDLTRLPWYVASGIITILLLLLLLLAAYLDGPLTHLLDWQYLRGPLLPTSIVIYVFTIYPLMGKLRERAILSLTPLLKDTDLSLGTATKAFSARKRWELISLLVGLVCFFSLSAPWDWVDRPIAVYAAATDALMFSILGLLVFNGINGTVRISQLVKSRIKVDIFSITKLVPIAHWCMGMSMAFVGGISISIIFQDTQNLRHWQTLVFYAGLILVALVIFFMSLWSTHSVILQAKRAELIVVRQNLEQGFRELRTQGTHNIMQRTDAVNTAIAAWAAYEQRILQVSDWPYNASIVRRLAASALVPSFVYLLKILLGIRL